MSTRLVAGGNTSTPNVRAPAYAAASTRLLVTERVLVAGATLADTTVPSAWAATARQRCSRLARE